MHRKKKSKFKPLKYEIMFPVLILVISISLILSIVDFIAARKNFLDNYEILKQQTEDSIVNTLKMINNGYNMLDHALEDKMIKAFNPFLAAYKKANGNPALIDLNALKRLFKGKMDFYILNKKGVIIKTTYKKDLGMDFSKFRIFKYIDRIRKGNKFTAQRIVTETRTGMLRKFAYMPTPDHNYLLEIGLRSDDFKQYILHLDPAKITSKLKKVNPLLYNIRIFQHVRTLRGIKADKSLRILLRNIYRNKKDIEIYDKTLNTIKRYIYVGFPRREGEYRISRIIELTYSQKIIYSELVKRAVFSISVGIASIILSIFLTVIISIKISGPIKELTDSVNQMKNKDFSTRINLKKNNEIGILADTYNVMADEIKRYINVLEEERKLLEIRVLERTQELFEKNRKIMQSINYAKTIQQSILPYREINNFGFRDHFALWKPRDIVGGDFYSFKNLDNISIIALADCTGHGVPGALMTMMASAVLTEKSSFAIFEQPSKYIQEINITIRENLHHTNKNQKDIINDDGMELGICIFDPENKKITYSGARIPLYYCKNDEFFHIKGDKQSVGYTTSKVDFIYKNHEIEIEDDMVFYLTSDGLTDQVGGEKNLPFGRKRLRKLLLENYKKPLNAQKQIIENEILKYQGKNNQRDDITLVAFKF